MARRSRRPARPAASSSVPGQDRLRLPRPARRRRRSTAAARVRQPRSRQVGSRRRGWEGIVPAVGGPDEAAPSADASSRCGAGHDDRQAASAGHRRYCSRQRGDTSAGAIAVAPPARPRPAPGPTGRPSPASSPRRPPSSVRTPGTARTSAPTATTGSAPRRLRLRAGPLWPTIAASPGDEPVAQQQRALPADVVQRTEPVDAGARPGSPPAPPAGRGGTWPSRAGRSRSRWASSTGRRWPS